MNICRENAFGLSLGDPEIRDGEPESAAGTVYSKGASVIQCRCCAKATQGESKWKQQLRPHTNNAYLKLLLTAARLACLCIPPPPPPTTPSAPSTTTTKTQINHSTLYNIGDHARRYSPSTTPNWLSQFSVL